MGVFRQTSREQADMEAIVQEHYAAVYRFCARRVGPELAQDAAQETFITAQKSMKRFDGRSTLGTWLFGIAHNHCRNLSRKAKHETSFGEFWDGEEMSESGSEQTLVDREALRQALKKLSPEHREVVLLHEVDGLTYEEAASVIGVPVGTIKSRLHHAFLNLRRALTGCEEVTA